MRGWQGEALTGVGRYMVRPGTAPLPSVLSEGAAAGLGVEGTPEILGLVRLNGKTSPFA